MRSAHGRDGAIRRSLRWLGDHPAYAGLCLVAAAEAAINAFFGWHYFAAGGAVVSLMMAGLLLGNEMIKWSAGDGIGEALAAGERWRAGLWSVVLAACLSISLPAHIGFIGMMRADTAAGRTAQADQGGATRRQLAQALDERGRLGTQRPAAAIEAERRLECGRVSRAYPDGVGPRCTALKAEEAAARRALELDTAIAGLQQARVATGGVAEGDPQVRVMGWLFARAGENDTDIRLALAVALAVAAEIITSIGFVALGSAGRGERLSLDALVAAGAVTPEVVQAVIPFRNDMLAPGGAASEEEVWAAYATWSRARGAEPMRRDVLVRLLGAIGMRYERGLLVGWSVRRAA